ncbi:Cen-like protein [Musa troglodytarum]|uniref:Cen-like protein n=1 Tax=Musa troglodytarum TaxID=320322 RepID=A0A9E7F8X7_9LILI|nr:Cen-like protein [Musa troglodytarum]
MMVTYNSSKLVCNGHEFYPSAVVSEPRVAVQCGDMRSFFTLVSIRVDISCLQSLPCDSREAGKEVVGHESPRPSIGIHRFVFVLFQQKRRHSVVAPPPSRDRFSTRRFAQENDLGLPVAAVYFNAQRETAARRL